MLGPLLYSLNVYQQRYSVIVLLFGLTEFKVGIVKVALKIEIKIKSQPSQHWFK